MSLADELDFSIFYCDGYPRLVGAASPCSPSIPWHCCVVCPTVKGRHPRAHRG